MAEEEVKVSESVEAVLARLDERTAQMEKRLDERFDAVHTRLDDLNVKAIKGGATAGTVISVLAATLQYFLHSGSGGQ